MNPFTRYYIHQAGGGDGGGDGGGGGGVGPIYSVPPFVQRGYGIGSFLGGLFRSIRRFVLSGIRTASKALDREALRTGSRNLTDIADNPQRDIRKLFQNTCRILLNI